MSTVYPGGIDDNITLPLVFDNITEVTAVTVNRLQQAIISVERTLGVNPQDGYTNSGGVATRLNGVDTQLASLNTGLANVITEVTALIAALDGEHINLGTPQGGFNPIGITTLHNTTPITEAINTFNNIMSYLAPATAQSMQGLAIDAVTSVPVFSGKVADVTGHAAGYFKNGLPAGSSYSFITKTQAFTLTTHNTGDATTGFSDADKGILVLNINNAGTITTSTFNLGVAFDEGYRTTAQGVTYDGYAGSATPPLLVVDAHSQIYSIAAFNHFPLWQKGVARITNTTLAPGYNYFSYTHTVGSSTRVSNLFEVFYDNGASNPTFPSTPTLAVSGSGNINYLSGIKFLTTGDSLQLQATINNAFVNTYLQAPLSYSFSVGIPTTPGDISDPSITVGPTGSSIAPNSTDHITINRVFNITTLNQQSVNQIATITYSNIYGNTFVASSPSNNILINTYNTHASTNTTESFVDEVYRLVPDINGGTGAAAAYPNDYVGIPPVIPAAFGNPGYWDATAILTNGNAQSFNAQLVYPTQNFTAGYAPAQNGGANYSGFNNTNSHNGQVYYRAMYSPGNPRSTGTLTIGGIVLTDLTQFSPNIKVEIKLPSVTGWLDLSLPFNNGIFNGTTGQGCRTGNSGNSFGWSVGAFTTGTSGFMYILRITLFNTSRQVTSLAESFTQTF